MGKRSGIMLPTLFTEKLFNKLPKPVFVQKKIEGDRLRSDISSNVRLLSSGNKEVISVPHIYNELRRPVFKGLELDGEMYRHGMRHSEIRSIVGRRKNIHPDHEKIKYYVYDIVASNTQEERNKYLSELFKHNSFKHIVHVDSHPVRNIKEMQYYYDKFLENGYEGIIIRHPGRGYKRSKVSTMLKLKPRASDFFTIIDMVEEVSINGVRKNTFGAFTCTTADGEIFSVGSGVTKYQRDLLWWNRKELIGERVKIRFQNYTKVRGVPKMQSIDKKWLLATENIIINRYIESVRR